MTKKQTIKDLGEFKSIEKITRDFIYRPELVKVGIGDDGAVVYTRPEMDENYFYRYDGRRSTLYSSNDVCF